MNFNRKLAGNLAAEAISRGKPLEWFETLYRQAADDESIILWADMRVNPNLATWLKHASFSQPVGRALVIGCGLGDDAEALQRAGLQVTAFDISETCIAWCLEMPWPLLREELREFAEVGLTIANFEDYFDSEDPPVRRFRVEYHMTTDRNSAPKLFASEV